MKFQHSLLSLAMIPVSNILQAEANYTDAMPSEQLLEFLGEWETSDGEWFDPLELEDNKFVDLLKSAADKSYSRDAEDSYEDK